MVAWTGLGGQGFRVTCSPWDGGSYRRFSGRLDFVVVHCGCIIGCETTRKSEAGAVKADGIGAKIDGG